MKLRDLAAPKYRWLALVVLALSLAIVIIDNSVLNVAVPYILRDLNTNLDAMEWVISGYALIIATLLITVGRLGDIFGRKKIWVIGLVFFAVGSFIASIAPNVGILFLGEAAIEAIGAAMMLTSSLSLIVTEFRGKERAIAFGVWGAVAGASGALGPLLGGYFTTYHSWRWSLRINVVVAIVAILGSVCIKEAKGEQDRKGFDFLGTLLSGAGLFALVFGLIEGQKYGWFRPNQTFSLGDWTWPISQISIIPVAFAAAILLILGFLLWEYRLEKSGAVPLVRVSIFKKISFSIGLIAVIIIALGQLGIFFVMPIYLQNVLGYTAFHTGLLFLIAAGTIFVVGPITGFAASKINPKWIVVSGMFILAIGALMMRAEISTTATVATLAPGLLVFGVGMAMASAQLTNIVLSAVPHKLSGEASALNATARQIGTALGIAIVGAVLVSSMTADVKTNIQNDTKVPNIFKQRIIDSASSQKIESGQTGNLEQRLPKGIGETIKTDIQNGITSASKAALLAAIIFVILGGLVTIFTKKPRNEH